MLRRREAVAFIDTEPSLWRQYVAGLKVHHPDRLGPLNWPMDRVLISSYVKGGQMPFGYQLQAAERNRLYQKLIQEYFAVDEAKPGILKAWLLGRRR